MGKRPVWFALVQCALGIVLFTVGTGAAEASSDQNDLFQQELTPRTVVENSIDEFQAPAIQDVSRDLPYRIRSTEYLLTELASSLNNRDNVSDIDVQMIMDRIQNNPELLIGYMVGRLTDYRMILDIRRPTEDSDEQRAGFQLNFEF